MANNTGWAAGRGQGLTYATAGFTAATFTSLATGSVVVASSAIVNTTALDLYADVSFAFTLAATGTPVGAYMSLYLLPLNQDATTYGDNTPTGTTAPGASYLVSSALVAITAGNGVIVGTFRGITLPPANFKFAIVNNLTVGLNGTNANAVVSYRTYNEGLNL
jgi:hypothetical protein